MRNLPPQGGLSQKAQDAGCQGLPVARVARGQPTTNTGGFVCCMMTDAVNPLHTKGKPFVDLRFREITEPRQRRI